MKALQPFIRENHYWQIIKRHKTLGTTVLLLVSALGIILTSLKHPIYEAQAKIKFKSNSFNSYLLRENKENPLIDNLQDLIKQDNFINTEIEVINSYPLIEKTINSLARENDTAHFLFDIENFSNNLKLTRVKNTNILKIKYKDSEPAKAAVAVNQLIVNYLENYIAVNQKESTALKQLIEQQLPEFEKKLEQTENAIRKIQEETHIIAPQEEAVIVVTNIGIVQQKIAELKGQIANVNAKSAYIRDKLGMDSDLAIAATIVGQSPDIQQAIKQLQQLELQLAQEKSRFPEDNPIVNELNQKIARQRQLVQQKIQTLADSQDVSLSRARDFGDIQQTLTAELIELEATNLGLNQQITYLLELEKAQQEKANLLPQALQKLKHLQRQLGVFQDDYESLLQQIRNIEATQKPELNKVQIVSYATEPAKPLRPNYINYLGSIGLGFLAASLIIGLAEITDSSLTTIEKAKKIFGYTWLGIIPDIERSSISSLTEHSSVLTLPKYQFNSAFHNKTFPQTSLSSINLEQLETNNFLPKVVVRDYPGASASESYRMLQSNIKFLSTYKEVKAIVVTSSVSKEGKSTVAANLACAMAQAKHKVLLIDANLHYPVQDRIWNKNSINKEQISSFNGTEAMRSKGLSNIIGEKINTRQVIQEIFPQLHLISSGIIPPSPATLLDSSRMKEIMENLRQDYDFIIIDTPALDLAADAPILGRIADGVLLVVKPNNINRSKANFAKEILLRSGQNVLGIVFNQIDPQVEPKNYFYHALEERQEDISESKIIEPSKEELWLTISQMSQKSKKPRVILTPEEINSIPKEQLQEIINYLQQDLEELTQLVKEQEEELFMQSQMVKKLQKKLNLSRDVDRYFLGQQLAQEQEHKNMLNETLVGQRRNIERKQKMLRQYHRALTIKQTQ